MILNEFIQLTRYKRCYTGQVLNVKKSIRISRYSICSKRLAPFLSEIIPVLERWGEIKLATRVREKLLKISAATIDRLLTEKRKRYRIKGRSARIIRIKQVPAK